MESGGCREATEGYICDNEIKKTVKALVFTGEFVL